MIKDKKTVIDGLKRLSDGQCKAPLENHPSWDINYDPLSLIWDAIDYVDNIDRVILNIVRDVLTSGGSIDTEADQNYICSVIEKRVEEVINSDGFAA